VHKGRLKHLDVAVCCCNRTSLATSLRTTATTAAAQQKKQRHTFNQSQRNALAYRSGAGERCCIGAGQTLCVYSPDDSTFVREMTS